MYLADPEVLVNIITPKGQLGYLHEGLHERYMIVCDAYGVSA